MSSPEEDRDAAAPCVLITSCDDGFKEEELVKGILGCGTLPEPAGREGPVSWYPWSINNKYYTAEVRLCAVPSVFSLPPRLAQLSQAFIAYVDAKAKGGLEKLNPWIPIVEEISPEVLVLVCDRVCDQGVTRHEAQQWCLGHAFELVELDPQEVPDEDDDFPESTGMKRIIQALNANVWSNVKMKDEHSQSFGLMSSLVASRHNNPHSCQDPASSDPPVGGSDSSEENENSESSTNVATPGGTELVDAMTDLDIQELATLTAGDADVDNFERLFTKLKQMKEKASSMPREQRKVHAEKVAKAFWMAIGGDDDEIDGLSSGEDN